MGKVRKDFTREFKIEAMRISYQTDKTFDKFAKDMGISCGQANSIRSHDRVASPRS